MNMYSKKIGLLLLIVAMFAFACSAPETAAPAADVEADAPEAAAEVVEEAMEDEAMDEEAMEDEASMDEESMGEESMEDEAMDEEHSDSEEDMAEEHSDSEEMADEEMADEEMTEEDTDEAMDTDAAMGEALTLVIDPAGSEARYEVDEEFFNRDVQFVTAIGTTSEIEGSLLVNLGDTPAISGGEIVVDISTLTTDSSRRDNAIRNDWLESNTYPLATFVPREIQNLSGDYMAGEEVTFDLVGDMTIREVTNELTFNVTGTFDSQSFSGTANTFLLMVDYGFEPPTIFNILEVTDGVTVTVDITAAAQ